MIKRQYIEWLEDKINDLQYQINCLLQILNYIKTKESIIDKYKGDNEDMLSSGDAGYYSPKEEEADPYP